MISGRSATPTLARGRGAESGHGRSPATPQPELALAARLGGTDAFGAGREEVLAGDGAALRGEPRRDQTAPGADLSRAEHAVAVPVHAIELRVAFRVVASQAPRRNVPDLCAHRQGQAYRQNRHKGVDAAS